MCTVQPIDPPAKTLSMLGEMRDDELGNFLEVTRDSFRQARFEQNEELMAKAYGMGLAVKKIMAARKALVGDKLARKSLDLEALEKLEAMVLASQVADKDRGFANSLISGAMRLSASKIAGRIGDWSSWSFLVIAALARLPSRASHPDARRDRRLPADRGTRSRPLRRAKPHDSRCASQRGQR